MDIFLQTSNRHLCFTHTRSNCKDALHQLFMATAGPSRLPYVDLSAPTASSNGASLSASAAARVPTRDVNTGNTSSHGSTTQESSNPAQQHAGTNGFHHLSESDGDEDDEEQEAEDSVRKSTTATYSTSDAIVHRAMRARTGGLQLVKR